MESHRFLYDLINHDLTLINGLIEYHEMKGDVITVDALKGVQFSIEKSLKYYREHLKINNAKEESK